jgi:hypothetical protein
VRDEHESLRGGRQGVPTQDTSPFVGAGDVA